ncbi:MAG: diacylglycerol kinase [Firmicutes bacterium]|nr:diacylglycerol kinase [Bacillota bacterium]
MERSPRQGPLGAGGRAKRRWAARPTWGAKRSLVERVWNASRGFLAAYREEPNLRFHCLAAGTALALARAVGLTGLPLLYLCGTIAFVMAAELANTAVERAVNLAAGDRYHPLAALAKDVAAGAVLVAALHAVAAAWILFVAPRGLAGLWTALVEYAAGRPLEAAISLAVVAGLGAAAALHGRRRGDSG